MPWLAGLAITAAATAYSIKQQSTAAKAQKEAAQQQNNLASLENRKARIKAVREARIKRAAMVAEGQAQGAQYSSGLAGGTSSLGAQLGANIGLANQREGFSQNIANLQNKAITAQNRAGIAGAVGKLGGSIFSDLGGWDNLFDTTKGNALQ
jgi:hypothetical protein